MKTSATQFELLLTYYMEQHGDLSKPSSNARGKIVTLRRWEELTDLLNSDGSGQTKTTEKWKKVWSDFKNNTKKKAARLHRAASGTGGGPACYAKLNEMEQRVLNLIGVHAATGMDVEEAGWSQEVNIHHTESESPAIPVPMPTPVSTDSLENIHLVNCGSQSWNEPGPSQIQPSPLPSHERNASPQIPPVAVETEVENTVMPSPTRAGPSSPIREAQLHPALSGQTTPRRIRPVRRLGTPRRRVRPAHTEEASQYFLRADEKWREFKMEQHRDNIEIKREQNRIREMELQTMREWRELGSRTIDLLEKLVNKYCRDE